MKRTNVLLTEKQIKTILYALDILESDYNPGEKFYTEMVKRIRSVEETIYNHAIFQEKSKSNKKKPAFKKSAKKT